MVLTTKLKKLWFLLFHPKRLLAAKAIEKILANGHYAASDKVNTSPAMCIAAKEAARAGKISERERAAARDLIQEHIRPHMFLKDHLFKHGKNEEFREDHIYKAWYVEFIKYLRGEPHRPLK